MNNQLGSAEIPGIHPAVVTQLKPENAQMRILNGPKKDTCFPLMKLNILIGRNDPPFVKVDIDLTECELDKAEMMISRKHSELQWVDNELFLVDMPNKNGTWVDNVKVTRDNPNEPSEPIPLHVGSLIRFANLETEIAIQ
jgi:hypothetical protein